MWSIFYYSTGGSVSLFTCSPLKTYCKHSYLETRWPAYPNFSARISIIFTCQMLSAHIIFPCQQPCYAVQGFFIPLICPTLKVSWPQFPHAKDFMPLLSVLKTWRYFFLYNTGSPHSPPSLVPWLCSHSFHHYYYEVLFLSEREIIPSVDVSQLCWQNKERGWMGAVI